MALFKNLAILPYDYVIVAKYCITFCTFLQSEFQKRELNKERGMSTIGWDKRIVAGAVAKRSKIIVDLLDNESYTTYIIKEENFNVLQPYMLRQPSAYFSVALAQFFKQKLMWLGQQTCRFAPH
jgi:hypothetical protein